MTIEYLLKVVYCRLLINQDAVIATVSRTEAVA